MNKYVFILILAVLGLVCLLIAPSIPNFNNFNLSILLGNIGSIIFVTSLISLYFELKGKEELIRFVSGEIKSAYEVRESGIVSFVQKSASSNLSQDIERGKKVTVVYAYSSRFLKLYEVQLERCLKNGGEVQIVLQAEDSPTITAMRSLDWDEDDISSNYLANFEVARRLSCLGRFSLYLHKGLRAYSCVIIDSKAHVTFATNSNGRSEVPKLILDGGDFFDFIKLDTNKLISQSVAKNLI